MATSPDFPPLGRPSQVEAATAKAELLIILLPDKKTQAETKDKLNGSTSQSGRLTATTGRLGRGAQALAVVGACIRRRVPRQK